MNLLRDMKDTRRASRSVSSSKRQTRENVSSLVNGMRDLAIKDMEMAVAFYIFPTLAITGKTCFQESWSHSWEGLEQPRLTLNGRRSNWGTFKQNGHTQVRRM